MNKEITVGGLIILFLGIIAALAIMPEIANQQSTLTTKTTVTDEVVDITDKYTAGGEINESAANSTLTNGPTAGSWQATSCNLESVTVTNASGTVLTVDTDYIIDLDTGNLAMLNTTDTNITNFASGGVNNNTLVDYTYCQDGYVNDSAGRSMAGLILLFTALALVAFTLYHLYRRIA